MCHVAPETFHMFGKYYIISLFKQFLIVFSYFLYSFVKKYSLFAFLCSFFWKGLFFIKTRRPNLEEGCQTNFGEIGRVETATEDNLEISPTLIGDLCERDAGWVSPGQLGVSASCNVMVGTWYSRSVKTVLKKVRLLYYCTAGSHL